MNTFIDAEKKLGSSKSVLMLKSCFFMSLLMVSSMASADEDNKREKGLAMVGKLLAGTGAGGMPLPDNMSRYTIEHLFGDVWQGEDLTLQDRSFVTCIVLIALNREAEMKLHFVGARNVGVPREKLEAAITHIAHYAGWPVSISALRVLNEVWPLEENSEEDAS